MPTKTKSQIPSENESDLEPAVQGEERFSFKATHVYAVLVVLAFAAGLLLGYAAWGRPAAVSSARPAAPAPAASIPTPDTSAARQDLMATLVPKVRHFKGDPNAPVTIIEFADFQCPFCGRHATVTGPQIDQQYIQTNKVRLGFWNFAFLGPESNWAAEAAECAAEQGKFWEYHDKLFNSQAGENQGAFNKDNLKKFAEEIGLDAAAFNDCLDSGRYAQLIQDDSNAASALGVRSTPTFVINGQALLGAQPFEVFKQAIEKELAGAVSP